MFLVLQTQLQILSRGVPSASEPGTEILKNRLKRCLSGGLAGSCESSVMKEPLIPVLQVPRDLIVVSSRGMSVPGWSVRARNDAEGVQGVYDDGFCEERRLRVRRGVPWCLARKHADIVPEREPRKHERRAQALSNLKLALQMPRPGLRAVLTRRGPEVRGAHDLPERVVAASRGAGCVLCGVRSNQSFPEQVELDRGGGTQEIEGLFVRRGKGEGERDGRAGRI